MTKKIKNSFLKMQGILRKGTVETLCMLFLTLLITAGCNEILSPDESPEEEPATEQEKHYKAQNGNLWDL